MFLPEQSVASLFASHLAKLVRSKQQCAVKVVTEKNTKRIARRGIRCLRLLDA